MRILLLSPGKLDFYGSDIYPCFYPRLGLRILAAMTPPSHSVTVLEGERANSVDVDQEVDLVGLSVLTPHARRAYGIADAFRQRGKKVVLGGPHPSLNPAEAKEHADAVVIGEGENVWPPLLKDFQLGSLLPFYQSQQPVSPADIPSPARLTTDDEDYPNRFPIQTGRGCSVGCAYCLDPILFGSTYAPRPVERIVEEVTTAKRLSAGNANVYFVGNLLGSPEPARELLAKVGPLHVPWCAEGDLFHLNDDEYLDTIRETGCDTIYVETRLVSRKVKPRVFKLYQEAAQRVLSKGLNLSVNFTIGYDDHDEFIVEDIWEWAIQGGLAPYLLIQLLTPWPGTPLFKHLDRQDRILTRDWNLYDNRRVVFRPKRMSPQALERMHGQLWRELSKVKAAHFADKSLATADSQRSESDLGPDRTGPPG